MRKNRQMLSGTERCPCGAGLQYRDCCKKKGIVWQVESDGGLGRVVKLNHETVEILEDLLGEFKNVFGRSPARNDYVFAHSNYLSDGKEVWKALREACNEKGDFEHLAYASEKTDRILAESNLDKVPDVDIEEWEEAADEYYALKEAGIDPHLVLDFSDANHAAIAIEAHTALELAVVHIGSYIDKCQRHKIRELHQLFSLYFAARSFNAAKTIYQVSKEFDTREMVALCRTIYECYLRIRFLRHKPEMGEHLLAQASVGNDLYHYKRKADGRVNRDVIVRMQSGLEYQGRFKLRDMAEVSSKQIDLDLHEEFYEYLCSVGHADVREITSYFSMTDGFLLAPKDSLQELLLNTLIALALLLSEMSNTPWATKTARRDARYCAKRLAKGVLKAFGVHKSVLASELSPTLTKLREIVSE